MGVEVEVVVVAADVGMTEAFAKPEMAAAGFGCGRSSEAALGRVDGVASPWWSGGEAAVSRRAPWSSSESREREDWTRQVLAFRVMWWMHATEPPVGAPGEGVPGFCRLRQAARPGGQTLQSPRAKPLAQ